jgi:hypothetical protein
MPRRNSSTQTELQKATPGLDLRYCLQKVANAKERCLMKSAIVLLIALVSASFLMIAEPVRAAETELRRPVETQTVWVKGHDSDELVEAINKMHVEMAAKGFLFAAMTPFTQHGTIGGVFLTYIRQ